MLARYVDWVLRHRVAVLVACALLTAGSIAVVSRAVIASSMLELFFGENPDYDAYRALADQFGDAEQLAVVYTDAELLTAAGIRRLQRIGAALEEIEEVERVDSLLTSERLRSADDALEVERWGELLVSSDDDALRAELIADPLVTGLLLAPDGMTTALLVELRSEGQEVPIEQVPALLARIRAAVIDAGVPSEALHLAGMVPESVAVTEQAHLNLRRIFPLAALALMLVVFGLFAQLWPVVITMGVALVAIAWVFAVAVLWTPEINLMMATVPAVIMIISFSDIIHLCSAYLLELRRGLAKEAAIRRAATEVGRACVYTSATTFVGFAALAFVPTPLFRQLGVILGLGVAVALWLAVTLTPIALSLLPAPAGAAAGRPTLADRAIDRLVEACLRLATGWPRTVVAGFALLGVAALAGLTNLRVETDLPARLAADHPVRVSQRFITEHLAGTTFVDLYLTVGEPDGWLEPARLDRLLALRAALEQLPGVDRTLSLIDLLERLHRELGDDPGDPLPNDRRLVAQYLLLFELAGGNGLDRLLDEDRRRLRVAIRLPGTGLVETAALGDQAVALAGRVLGTEVRAEATGLSYLFGKWVAFVVDGQQRGLLFAVLSIAAMMILVVRRASGGLVAMIPNLLPLLCLGGYLGGAWPTVDSDTLIVAMLAIGMAVDDTIHFLSRLALESPTSASVDEALRRTFACSGRAIVQTSVILCVGFLPFALSDYFTTQILGTLLPGTLMVALVADLLLATALVELGWLRVRSGEIEPPRRGMESTSEPQG